MAKRIETPKSIDIPKAIRLPDGPSENTFPDFLIQAMDAYAPSGKGLAQVRQACKIMDKIDAMDGHLILEDAEFTTLKAAVDTVQFPPKAARMCISFYEAVEAAKDPKEPDEAK